MRAPSPASAIAHARPSPQLDAQTSADLAAALNVLEEEGEAPFLTRAVCAIANVSAPTLYHHYSRRTAAELVVLRSQPCAPATRTTRCVWLPSAWARASGRQPDQTTRIFGLSPGPAFDVTEEAEQRGR